MACTLLYLIASQDEVLSFSSRWLSLMLSQEFPLPDVLRIWDSLLTDSTPGKDFLIDVCVAMVVLARNDILNNEFGENMKLLQVGCRKSFLQKKSKRVVQSVSQRMAVRNRSSFCISLLGERLSTAIHCGGLCCAVDQELFK